MKRAALVVVGAGVISIGLMLALRAQEQQAGAKSSAVSPAPASGVTAAANSAAPATPEGKIAFTFVDDAQLQKFAQLWRQRQAALTKMAVLQSYWKDEQTVLDNMNTEFKTQYNIDVSKNYRFDPDKKVLIEQTASTEQSPLMGAPDATQAAGPSPATTPSNK